MFFIFQLELFTLQVTQNKAAFNFYNIFDLDYTLLYEVLYFIIREKLGKTYDFFKVVALITSYTIVAVQLEGSLEKANKILILQNETDDLV